MLSTRSAAIKVEVCQCPCGTCVTQRSLVRLRPVAPGHFGVQARFVDEDQAGAVPAGLRLAPNDPGGFDVRPFLFGGVRRFFIAQSHPIEPVPQGGEPDLDAEFLPAALLQFDQRQVRLLGDPAPQGWRMWPQPRTPVSTNWLGPANLSGARAARPRCDDPQTQIFTQWSHGGSS